MDIYVHKSSSNYDVVRCCLGGPFGVATASAISDAVTYKAVDILKVENYKLYYFWHYVLSIDYSLCSLQANIRSTTLYLCSSLSRYHWSIFLSVHPPSVAVRLVLRYTQHCTVPVIK